MPEYNEALCKEIHLIIDRRLDSVEKCFNDLVKTLNGKFNKIIGMFIGVLFTIIGSLVVFIITGK